MGLYGPFFIGATRATEWRASWLRHFSKAIQLVQANSPQNQAIEEALAPLLRGRGFELVLCAFLAKSKVLRLFIERSAPFDDAKATGVTLDDCSEVSRLVSDVLDGEGLLDAMGHYSLEVSSPGLDRPLTRAEHFRRFVGRDVQIRATAPVSEAVGRKFVARLVGADDSSATLLIKGQSQNIQFDYSQIDSARLVPQV